MVSDIEKKCDIFNSYFAEQYIPLVNNSKLPSVLKVHTELLVEKFLFSADYLGDIIKKLDPNKAHGHDMISIRMLKLCQDPIWKRLEIIFKSCLKKGIFSDKWKKANVALFHKSLSNYQHISDNILLSPSQFGFCTGDSCMN